MPIPSAPTMLLAAGGVMLILGRWVRTSRWYEAIWLVAVVATIWLMATGGVDSAGIAEREIRRAVWIEDPLAVAGQALALALGVVFGIGSFGICSVRDRTAERFGFLAFQMAGGMLIATANDAVSLVLSAEIVQFASLALRRTEREENGGGDLSTDSMTADGPRGDNLLWIGLVASLCIWLGIALLASVTATTQFDEMRLVLADAYSPGPNRVAIGTGSKLGLLGIGLIVAGLGSRIGLVPWYLATVEAVSGVGYWTAGCVLVAGQLAGVLALARLCGTVWIGFGNELIVLLSVLSGLTFVASGAIAMHGLSKDEGSLRRWLVSFVMLEGAWLTLGLIAACADLATPGNSLAAAGNQPSALALLLFAIGGSLFGLTGLFVVLTHLSRGEREVEYIDELLGLGQLAPVSAAVLLVLLASLIGHPPLWGSWGNWMLLVAGLNVRAFDGHETAMPHTGLLLLSVVATAGTLLSAAVVLRFARVMFFDAPLSRVLPRGRNAALSAGGFAALVLIAVGLLPSRLLVPLSSIRATNTGTPSTDPSGSKRGEATAQIRAE